MKFTLYYETQEIIDLMGINQETFVTDLTGFMMVQDRIMKIFESLDKAVHVVPTSGGSGWILSVNE